MANTLIKYIPVGFVFIVATLGIYLGLSFLSWDFNPGNWTEGQRFFACLFWALAWMFSFLTFDEISEKGGS